MDRFQEITNQINDTQQAFYDVERQERKLESTKVQFEEILNQKEQLFFDINRTWLVGDMAYRTSDNQNDIRRYQDRFMNELMNEYDEIRNKKRYYQDQEEDLIFQRKKIWEEENK
ncbi:DUF3958 family protein [Listeria booriae]|uniref:DUF3958 family protein n=1 Tax=Listeria booriae TaxID=1552123 RepID=UPI0016280C08|nr:DUF3958 family protein [Listeria booriae]MBC2259881.1 DUF3958 family protein [Listeria booriae]MBC6129350.1 DUF3958 family protein [Listeria booriae]